MEVEIEIRIKNMERKHFEKQWVKFLDEEI